MSQESQPNPERLVLQYLFNTSDEQGKNLILLSVFQAAEREFEESGLKWWKAKYIAGRISDTLGLPENEALARTGNYLDIRSSNTLGGNMTELPTPNTATRNREFPRHLVEEEYRIGTFVMGYIFHRVGRPEIPLTLTGKQFLGNTEEESIRLVRWMDENLDRVLDYYAWVELNPEDELIKEFKEKQAQGKLWVIDDEGWVKSPDAS